MRKFFMMSVLCAGLAQAAAPVIYTNNSIQYVNPFDFTKVHGGKIAGKSTDQAWTITLKGKTLKLIRNSKVAYLDGRRVTLSSPVGYAKGVLLAPHGDLTRLLNVKATQAVIVKRGAPQPGAKVEPPKVEVKVEAPRPAMPPKASIVVTPAAVAPAPAAPAVVTPPAAPITASAPEAVAAATPTPVVTATPPAVAPAKPARAEAPASTLGAYVIQSAVQSSTDPLKRANHEQTLDGDDTSVDTVVKACHDGVSKRMSAGLTAFASRPFVFVHPDNVYSVRNSVEVTGESGGTSRSSFTCLSQRRGNTLVMFIDLQGGR